MIVRLITGLAFAVPPDAVELIHVEPDPAADADEPVGCPGNPIRARTLRVLPDRLSAFDAPSMALIAAMDVRDIKIIGNDHGAESVRHHLESFSLAAEQRENCGTTPEGLAICYRCREDMARPGYCEVTPGAGASSDGRAIERAAFLVVDEQSTAGPDNLPWVAACGSESTGGARLCFANYMPRSGVSIAYMFGLLRLDMTVLRQTDQIIRQAVLALRAPEYDGTDLP